MSWGFLTSSLVACGSRLTHSMRLAMPRRDVLNEGVSTTTSVCDDPIVLDLWHPLSSLDDVCAFPVRATTWLLGYRLHCWRDELGQVRVVCDSATADEHRELPTLLRYGYVWTSLGTPSDDLFEIPEVAEHDRRSLNAGSIQVATSAPRAVENFLDMGHFPYVHA